MLLFSRCLFLVLLYIGDFDGKVVGVIDGDTIEVMQSGKAIRIRLNGIDCPESNQPYGSKAKQYVSGLIYNKEVKVKVKELDRYGRTIADIYLADGTWLNKKLVADGFAWHYKHYSSNEELASSEVTARKFKVGLWQDANPTAPWEFRKQRRGN